MENISKCGLPPRQVETTGVRDYKIKLFSSSGILNIQKENERQTSNISSSFRFRDFACIKYQWSQPGIHKLNVTKRKQIFVVTREKGGRRTKCEKFRLSKITFFVKIINTYF